MKGRRLRNAVFSGLCCLGLSGLVFVGSIGAYMTDMKSASNVMSIGNNTIEIVENFQPPEGGYVSGDKVVKEVKVRNLESVPCYIRVYLQSNDNQLNNAVALNSFFNHNSDIHDIKGVFSNWIYGDDGWFYYIKPVEVGSTTTNLIDSVYLKSDEKYWFDEIDFNMYVYAESIQDLGLGENIKPSDFSTKEEYDIECTKRTWEKYKENFPKSEMLR